MRLKNIKGAKEAVESSKYVIQNPKEHIGHYHKIFDNDNKIHIEIGMGKGDFLIGMAIKYPSINFIGIEKYDSVLIKALQKMTDEIKNIRFIKFDATEITEIFDHEIDTIYLNFSDPWPKNRHEHRRLTSTIFLNRYNHLFENNNHIVMKTDNRKLFEFSLMSFNDNKFHIEKISLDLYNDDIKDNVATEYETKFVKLGNVIYLVEVNR